MSEVENNRYSLEDEKLLKVSHPYSYNYIKRLAEKYKVKRMGKLGVFVNSDTLIREILQSDAFISVDWTKQYRGFRSPLFGTTGLQPHLQADLLAKLEKIDMEEFSQFIETGIVECFNYLDDELTVDTYVDMVEWSDGLCLELICHLLGVPRNEDYLHRKSSVKHIISNIKAITGPVTKKNQRQFLEVDIADFSDTITASYRYSNTNTIPSWFKTNGFTVQETRDVIITLCLSVIETLRPLLPRVTSLLVETEHIKFINEHNSINETALTEIFRITCPVPLTVLKATKNYTLESLRIKTGETVILSSKFAAQRNGNLDLFRQHQETVYDYCFGNLDILSKRMVIEVSKKLMIALRDVDQANSLKVRAKTINHSSLNGEYKNLKLEAN